MEIHPKEAEIISFVLSRVKQLISIWLKEEIVEKLSGTAHTAPDGFTSGAAEYLQSIKLWEAQICRPCPLYESV